MNIATYILLTLAFIAEGLSQGQKNWMMNNTSPDKYYKFCMKWWHKINILFIALLFFGIVMQNELFVTEVTLFEWWKIVGIKSAHVIGFRFVFFDYAHNYAFKQNVFYVGRTSVFDRLTFKFPLPLFLMRVTIFVILTIEYLFYY